MNAYDKLNLPTGPWIGAVWNRSPKWTPYAQAIANHYPIQLPWFKTLSVNIDKPGAALPRISQTTQPYLYDVLIWGAHAFYRITSANSQLDGFVYLNITHQETGIPWAASSRISFFPLPALAGLRVTDAGPDIIHPSPLLKLPEAFFLPAHSRLKLDWTFLFPTIVGLTSTVNLTLVGTQLINPNAGFKAPEKITMPNGERITVGSRVPWFSTIPFGEFQSRSVDDFTLTPGEQTTQFIPQQDCDVEIHDLYMNMGDIFSLLSQDAFLTKLSDMGAQTLWTPTQAPLSAVLGQQRSFYATLPFTKPYVLKRGHRLQLSAQDNSLAQTLTARVATIRGVRRCEY